MSGLDETVFVTWQGLEESLKGIRQELQPKERVVIEMANQTDPVSNLFVRIAKLRNIDPLPSLHNEFRLIVLLLTGHTEKLLYLLLGTMITQMSDTNLTLKN